MTIVGLWSEQEIKESYTPSHAAIVAGIALVALVGVSVRFWGGKKRKEFWVAWGAAALSALTYVCLAQWLARDLCVEAPLTVKVHGILIIPFFLAIKDSGLLILLGVFVVTNILVFQIRRGCQLLPPVLLNAGLAAVLSILVWIAYLGACMGLGVPLE